MSLEGTPPFSYSVGERKIMNHFVVKFPFSFFICALPRCFYGESIPSQQTRSQLNFLADDALISIQTPGNGITPLNLAMVFSLSSRLERLTFGNLSRHSNGRTA